MILDAVKEPDAGMIFKREVLRSHDISYDISHSEHDLIQDIRL